MMIKNINKFLNGSISPMVYIMTLVSAIIGLAFGFTELPEVRNSLIYKNGLPIGTHLWGQILFVSAIVTFIGLVLKREVLIKYGAMGAIFMFLFAGVTYVQFGFYYSLVTFALFYTSFYVYLYLGSSLHYLQREAKVKNVDMTEEWRSLDQLGYKRLLDIGRASGVDLESMVRVQAEMRRYDQDASHSTTELDPARM